MTGLCGSTDLNCAPIGTLGSQDFVMWYYNSDDIVMDGGLDW